MSTSLGGLFTPPQLPGGDTSSKGTKTRRPSLEIQLYVPPHPSAVQQTHQVLANPATSFVSPSITSPNLAQSTSSSEITFHQPQEMQQLLSKVNDIMEREKMYPLKLHDHRVNADKVTVDIVKNYTELINMLQEDVNSDAKLNAPTKSAMSEIINLLREQFDQFQNFALQNDASMSKTFAEYKELVAEQFGAVMHLELANMHNGLSIWRDNFMLHNCNMLHAAKQANILDANQDRDTISRLQTNLNALNLRHGIPATEKKTADQKVLELEKEMGTLLAQHKKLKVAAKAHLADQERVVNELNKKIDAKEDVEKMLLAELDGLKGKNVAQSTELKEARTQAKEAQAIIREIKEKEKADIIRTQQVLSENASLKQRNSNLVTELVGAQKSVAKLRPELSQVKAAKSNLAHQLDKFQNIKEQLSQSRETVARYHGQILLKDDEIKDLNKKMTSSTQQVKELNDRIQYLATEQTRASEGRANQVEDEQKMKRLENEVTRLTQKLEEAEFQPKPIAGNDAPDLFAVELDPATSIDPTTVKTLKEQVKIYQALLSQSTYDPAIPRINCILMEKGLHKNYPKQHYVKPQYYSARLRARGQWEKYERVKDLFPAERLGQQQQEPVTSKATNDLTVLIEMIDFVDCI